MQTSFKDVERYLCTVVLMRHVHSWGLSSPPEGKETRLVSMTCEEIQIKMSGGLASLGDSQLVKIIANLNPSFFLVSPLPYIYKRQLQRMFHSTALQNSD